MTISFCRPAARQASRQTTPDAIHHHQRLCRADGAILGGSILVFFVNERFRDKSYAYTIGTVTISFVCVILVVGKVLSQLDQPDMARMYKNGLIWAVVVAITQLFLQVNSKFGAGVFRDILRGKYNTPREEKRIFMFLDINASTTIAETLGDKRYHAFLKDFFTDITNPILENRGEIYQYVGDEVIIAWRYREGFAESNCVQCFFDIKDRINALQEKYRSVTAFSRNSKRGYIAGR